MFQYNTIEEALEDLRQGKMILCTDDRRVLRLTVVSSATIS